MSQASNRVIIHRSPKITTGFAKNCQRIRRPVVLSGKICADYLFRFCPHPDSIQSVMVGDRCGSLRSVLLISAELVRYCTVYKSNQDQFNDCTTWLLCTWPLAPDRNTAKGIHPVDDCHLTSTKVVNVVWFWCWCLLGMGEESQETRAFSISKIYIIEMKIQVQLGSLSAEWDMYVHPI